MDLFARIDTVVLLPWRKLLAVFSSGEDGRGCKQMGRSTVNLVLLCFQFLTVFMCYFLKKKPTEFSG